MIVIKLKTLVKVLVEKLIALFRIICQGIHTIATITTITTIATIATTATTASTTTTITITITITTTITISITITITTITITTTTTILYINIMIMITIISIDALAKAQMLKNKINDYNLKGQLINKDTATASSNIDTTTTTNTDTSSSNKSTYEEKKVFKDMLTFPTTFTIKIVGTNHPTFVNDIIASVATEIGCLPDTIKYSISNSKQGNYISITITPYFQNSDEIYAAYSIISKDPRVKYVI